MLGYLKKFTIDILPSILATIVGAFIVHHYVIPAATPKNPAPAVANVTPKADEATEKDSLAKDSFAKGVAEKSAIEKTAEKAAEKSNDAPPVDSRKRHNAARTATRTESSEPATEERRDANNLARAAIERLRQSESSRTVAVAPVQTVAPAAPVQQVQPALPALPTVTPQPEVFTAGTGPVRLPPNPQPVRSADATKPTPPEAIPAPPPLALHDDIVTTATSRATTVADDVMSAAKSIIHTVLPR